MLDDYTNPSFDPTNYDIPGVPYSATDTSYSAPEASPGNSGAPSYSDISNDTSDATTMPAASTANTPSNPSQGSIGGALSKALSSLGLGGGDTSNTAALKAAIGLLSAYGNYKQNAAGSKLPNMPAMGALPALPGSSTAGYGPNGGYNFANYAGAKNGLGYAPKTAAPPAPSYFTYGTGPEHQFFQQVTGKGAPIAPVTMARGGHVPTFDMGGMVPNMGMSPAMMGQPNTAMMGPPPAPTRSPMPAPQGAPPAPMGAPQQPRPPSTMMQRMQAAKPFAKGGANPMPMRGALHAAMNPGTSRHVTGPGDGTSDSIPARLANGEYVMDAQLVSMLGNGDNSAGAKRLDEFRKNVRAHKGTALAKGKMAPDAKPIHKYMGGQ